MRTIDVAAAVIEREGRVLLARRAPGRRHAGLWEFPGGRVEPGELPEAGLERELLEELDLRAEVGALLDAEFVQAPDPGEQLRILFFAVVADTTGMVLRDHDRAEWIPYAELGLYRLVPADRAFVSRRFQPGVC